MFKSDFVSFMEDLFSGSFTACKPFYGRSVPLCSSDCVKINMFP